MTMSRRLDVALHETILAHAEQFQKSELEMVTILTALSSAAGIYLGQIPTAEHRRRAHRIFCKMTADATAKQARQSITARDTS